MEGLKSHKTLWGVELHKLFSSGGRKLGALLCIFIFVVIPWFLLTNFEERFERFKWHYLDESYLNFVIYASAKLFSWIMIITIPWLHHLIFGEVRRSFLKKSNKIFTHLICTKALMYAIIGFILFALSWISTYILYRYICGSQGIELEPNAWHALVDPGAYLFLRYLAVFPLIIVLFLSLSKNSGYLTLVSILLFSVFSIIPFDFHYTVHHAGRNQEITLQAVIAGLVLVGVLFAYYRFISTKGLVRNNLTVLTCSFAHSLR